MPFVYLITHNETQKKYVGKANDLRQRWKAHRSSAAKAQPTSYIGMALKAHGVSSFTFSVLEELATEDEAYAAEVRWISTLGTNQPGMGYNLDSGGMGGKTAAASTREKQSAHRRRKARPPEVLVRFLSPESRLKAAQSNRGQTRSEETKVKMSASQKGRAKSKEAVAKQAAKIRGRKAIPEARAKMSQARKGKPLSDAHLVHMREAAKQRRTISEATLTRIHELSHQGLRQTDIARLCGIGQTSVSRILRKSDRFAV